MITATIRSALFPPRPGLGMPYSWWLRSGELQANVSTGFAHVYPLKEMRPTLLLHSSPVLLLANIGQVAAC